MLMDGKKAPTMWASATTAVSTIAALVGLFLAWRHARDEAYRRSDVFQWANDVIESLQNLSIVGNLYLDKPQSMQQERVEAIVFKTSILLDQGRLLFKNSIIDDFGSEKEPAYRGYRPKILDPIVLSHQIARSWHRDSANLDSETAFLAEQSARKFLSLAQNEVGRSRLVSAETGSAGDSVHLKRAIALCDPNIVASWEEGRRRHL
jgi:hypothetical protein